MKLVRTLALLACVVFVGIFPVGIAPNDAVNTIAVFTLIGAIRWWGGTSSPATRATFRWGTRCIMDLERTPLGWSVGAGISRRDGSRSYCSRWRGWSQALLLPVWGGSPCARGGTPSSSSPLRRVYLPTAGL